VFNYFNYENLVNYNFYIKIDFLLY